MLTTISLNNQAHFDWQTLVAQNKPGQETALQRARLEQLPELVARLNKWANQHNIAVARAEVSAYAAVVALPMPLPYDSALLMAQFALWAFDVDDYVDRKDYTRFNQTEPNGWLSYFDTQFYPIIRPFYQDSGLTLEQGQACGLPQPPATTGQTAPAQVEATSLNLEAALRDILSGLKNTWEVVETTEFRLTNFIKQATQMLGMFRSELITNATYRQTKKLPRLEEYLNQSKFSIGIHPVAAIAVGLEPAPSLAWHKAQEALDSAAIIVRLANDSGNYKAEMEEGKVTSLTITLADKGFDPMAAPSYAISQAKKPLQARLETEISLFAEQLAQLADGPLTYWLQNTVAFAIAMYEKGSFIKPT